MKCLDFVFVAKLLLAMLVVAVAAEFSIMLRDSAGSTGVSPLAPVYGLSLGIFLVGGWYQLPVVFLGALLPALFAEVSLLQALSVPVAATVTALLGAPWLRSCGVSLRLGRVRDVLLIFCIGSLMTMLVAAGVESAMLCLDGGAYVWSNFWQLIQVRWLAASIGAAIILPVVFTWTDAGGFRMGARNLFEVLLWFTILIFFGFMTFRNWAPTDVLFYPMELAVFPIMSWAALRFGLRGASAGVLALALLAAWVLVLGDDLGRTASSANVWVFIGIVSVTSICLASVMTELRAREAQIAENESRLSAFTEALPDAAFVLSEHGQILDVFATASKVKANHGVGRESDMRGKYLAEAFGDSVVSGFMEVIGEALRTAETQSYEYRLQLDCGESPWFEARVSPMAVAVAAPGQVVWVAYDITARKNAEAALEGQDRILKATASANNGLLTIASFDEAVGVAIRELGTALQVDRLVMYEVNGDLTESAGTLSARFEWLSQSISSVIQKLGTDHPQVESVFPGWLEILKKDQPVLELQHEWLAAESVLAQPMWLEGKLYGFLTVEQLDRARDWSESEKNALRVLASSLCGLILICRHEQELRSASRKAHVASVAKGEFLAVMSHEIRIPMNAILGYADLLRQSALNETQEEQVAIIKRSGSALMDLINSILDYSKIESQALELERRRFDLEQVVCEALEVILPMAKQKGLAVDYDLAPELEDFYIGDAYRLRQILMNLANNAVKFTESGFVKIEVCMAQADKSHGEARLHFTVSDSGCGIDPVHCERIFHAFSQADSSTTRKFGGTGLGLAISQRLVERMGGEIWVESELGKGSRFQFAVELPCAEEGDVTQTPFELEVVADEDEGGDFSVSHPLRVLICEDDDDHRHVLCEALQTLGYQPRVADCADDAAAMLSEGRGYDVVLFDVPLPDQKCLNLTRQIREGMIDTSLKDLYVIVVTAYAMNEGRESCIQAGMNDYLSKPVDLTLLKAALSNACLAKRS